MAGDPAHASSEPFSPTPTFDWLAAHTEELARHRGRHVAIHPERGVVLSYPTMEEVVDALVTLSAEDRDVVLLDYVRTLPTAA